VTGRCCDCGRRPQDGLGEIDADVDALLPAATEITSALEQGFARSVQRDDAGRIVVWWLLIEAMVWPVVVDVCSACGGRLSR
jgi:hypothetical protein